MTAGELAEALLTYGADRPVEVRATPFLPRGAVEVSASSPTGDPGDVEVLLSVGAAPADVDGSIPF